MTNKSDLREGLELRDSLFRLKNLSEQEKDLAVRNFSPSVKEFWRSVWKIPLTDEQAGDLISGAEDFALACRFQKNAALIRRGGEIQGHSDLKAHLKATGRAKELAEIERLETDRLFWSEKRVKRKLDSILRELTDVEGSVTLRSHAPLEILVAARALRRQEQSQSDLHTNLRSRSLRRMVEIMKSATNKPHWRLIADAISLASGGAINLDASSLRIEHDRAQKRADLAANMD